MSTASDAIVDRVARVLHAEHARYIEPTAPFERCPGRALERLLASQIVDALIVAGDIVLPLREPVS